MLKTVPVGEEKQEIKLALTSSDDRYFADFRYLNGVEDRFTIITAYVSYRQVFSAPRKLVYRAGTPLKRLERELLPRYLDFDDENASYQLFPGLEDFQITEIQGCLNVNPHDRTSNGIFWYNLLESLTLIGNNDLSDEKRQIKLKEHTVEHLKFRLNLSDMLFHWWGKWDREFPEAIMHPRITDPPWNMSKEVFEASNEKTRQILETYYPHLLPDTPSEECHCLSKQ
jgi:hypothetical protein